MININRHNYETFFLLYIDGELSAAERMAVEYFIQENPDLSNELEALQQTTLLMDEAITMPGKSDLYRSESTEIGLHNHTEQFLLYVDHELSTEGTKSVETFVLQHPELQESFMQLKQTKLPDETIVFPYKESLYRNSETEKRPVVYMRWWRMAAAAAVIGFSFFIWTISGNESVLNNDQSLAATTIQSNPSSIDRKATDVSKETILESSAANTTKPTNIDVAKNVMEEDLKIKQLVASNISNTLTAEDLNNKPELIIERQNIISAAELNKAPINTPAFNGIAANVAIDEKDMMKAALVNNETELEKDITAQQVVYKELDTESDGENKSLLIGSVEINKDKLRGIFRKATSIFRSKKSEEAETTGSGPSRLLK